MFDLILWPCLFVYFIFWIFRFFFPSPNVSLNGKSILISGCDTGFGYLLVKRINELATSPANPSPSPLSLSFRNVKVFAGCLTEEGVSRLRAECSADIVVPFILDISQQESLQKVREVMSPHLLTHPLFALVNNAGIAEGAFVEWTPMAMYRRVMEVNFFGHVEMTRMFLDDIQRQKGHIVNITSCAGIMAAAGMSAYAASKFALEAFSDSLRREMIPWGVKVSLMEPFFFKTQIIEGASTKLINLYNSLPVAVKGKYGETFVNTATKAMDSLPQISGNPAVVVEELIHSIVSSSPFIRYHPGIPSKLIWALSILPAQCGDVLENIKMVLKKDSVPIGARTGTWQSTGKGNSAEKDSVEGKKMQ